MAADTTPVTIDNLFTFNVIIGFPTSAIRNDFIASAAYIPYNGFAERSRHPGCVPLAAVSFVAFRTNAAVPATTENAIPTRLRPLTAMQQVLSSENLLYCLSGKFK
jgi:hypothetical protein